MDAWSTVIGQRTMESINNIARDVGENLPTLRDKFAIEAMNAITTCTGYNNLDSILGEYGDSKVDKIAEASYKLADAMIKARKNK